MGNATFDVYAATETAGVASECQFHTGLHLFEDLVVAEVVDGNNQPVPPGVPGEKILVTVLFGRTQPLIRYEMSDSIISSERVHCPCGRPYPLIEGVQGRVEEALAFPARAGGQIRVQPAVFHSVMDAVPAEGWQLVQEPDRLAVLLAGAPDAFDGDGLAGRLMHELRSRGVLAPQIDVRRVRAIPRTALGKAPLIKKSRGILIANAGVYDALSRLLLSPLVKRIAADVAAVAPDGARVLEVGCGPGLLSIRLGRQHGLEVTGLDLDPAMIARAQANTDRPENGDRRQPSFLVGDVAALAFPDGSFDLVVSTLSMHHWADPAAGLAEIGRVLRPGARALIWDFRPGARPHPFGPRHAHMPDPVEHTRNSPLRVVKATPWVWPWRFNLTQRIELVRGDGSPGPSGHGATSAETDSDPLSSPG